MGDERWEVLVVVVSGRVWRRVRVGERRVWEGESRGSQNRQAFSLFKRANALVSRSRSKK